MNQLYRKTLIAGACVAVLYVLLFRLADRPAADWCRTHCLETRAETIGRFFSALATGSCVRLALAGGFIAVLLANPLKDCGWTRAILFICVSAAIALCVGDGLKYLLGRHRPIDWFTHGQYGLAFFQTEWHLNSSPSGHTLRAFAVCTALALLFRRAAWGFWLLAACIGASRVVVTAHYPSDVLFGATIGILAALWTAVFLPPRRREPEAPAPIPPT